MLNQKDAIDIIKSRVPASDALKRFFPEKFRERGNSHCPYHDDKTPSAQVDDMLYCHGCGKKADALDLYAEAHGVTIREAIIFFAGELGIDPDGGRTALPTIEEVLFGWGITRATMDVIRSRVKLLHGNKEYPPAIAFNCTDFSGKTVLGNQYIPVGGGEKKFSRGMKAKVAFFRIPGSGRVVVTEGIKDALAVKEAMPDADVVAILSANFTNKLSLLPGDGDIPVLFLDGDEPGKKATEKSVRVLDAQCYVVDWSRAPAGCKDPHDILKAGGKATMVEMIETATDPPPQLATTEHKFTNNGKEPKQADILIGIGRRLGTFFHTSGRQGFARIPVNNHQEIYPIRGQDYKDALRREYYLMEQSSPSAQAIQDAVDMLEAIALYDWPQEDIYTRIAHVDGKIYLDMCDPGWRVIEITQGGWRILDKSPVNFRRLKGMLPLPIPVDGGSVEDLRPHLNLPEGEEGERAWKLIVGWMMGALSPGPYPVAVFQAEQGAAKSFTCRTIKNTIDPTLAPIRTPPREERDLVIACVHSHVVAYDNLSGVPDWLSDALCRVATGAGFSGRKYYTDDEETIFQYKRPLILNGIDRVTSRNDLTDRSIFIDLPPIPKAKRKDEAEILAEIEKVKPGVLGALLRAASAALRKEAPRPAELPRMADFALWVNHAESAIGWEQGSFLAAYNNNRAGAIHASVDADPFATAVAALVEEKGSFVGTASELLAALNKNATEATRGLKAWPKAPNIVSKRLRRAAPFLRELGVDIDGGGEPTTQRPKVIRIDWVGKTSSISSTSSKPNNSNNLQLDDTEKSIAQKNESIVHPAGLDDALDDAKKVSSSHNKLESLKLDGLDGLDDKIPTQSNTVGDDEVLI